MHLLNITCNSQYAECQFKRIVIDAAAFNFSYIFLDYINCRTRLILIEKYDIVYI